jgi:hypothetical protein
MGGTSWAGNGGLFFLTGGTGGGEGISVWRIYRSLFCQTLRGFARARSRLRDPIAHWHRRPPPARRRKQNQRKKHRRRPDARLRFNG